MTQPLVAIADVVQSKTGNCDPGKSPLTEITYVDIAAIDPRLKAITGARRVWGSEAPSRARKLIRAGDVLVSTVRPNLNAVASVPAVLDGQVASTGFCVLRATERVLPRYLFYFVRSTAFVAELTGLVSGALYPAVSDSQILAQQLPLPPLSEQERRVDLISRAEGILHLRHEAQRKAAELIPALFLDRFGDPASNPKGWPTRPLGDLLTGCDYGTSRKSSVDGAGIPVLRMGNVSYAGDLDVTDLKHVELDAAELGRQALRPGDLLFNRTNSKELVGKTGLWDGRWPAVAASYFIRLRVRSEHVLPEYVWATMNSKHMKRVLFATARGAIGQANINTKELKALEMMVPPLDLQQRFVEEIAAVRAIQTAQVHALRTAQATFDALLHRAFAQ